jgi:glycosyltransferase involved in cell wall biosynthesis
MPGGGRVPLLAHRFRASRYTSRGGRDVLNILWHSTAPWGPSSYSILTKRTVPGIVGDGHKVTVSTWYGLQGEPQIWRVPRGEEKVPVVILPGGVPEAYGVDVVYANYLRHECNVIITCMDAWVMPASVTCQTKFAPWLPVDFDPAPQQVVDAVSGAIYPMVFSQWGTDVLKRQGIDAHYVPCSADAEKFSPIDKRSARNTWQIPETCDFLVSVVAANKDPDDRKGLFQALMGFAKFAATHAGACMYLHTNWQGPVNVGKIIHALGIDDKVFRPDHYAYQMGLYPDTYLQMVYSGSDVLLNPAQSEGFGLPILEAQLCGCPVAATDFSTTRELMFDGWPIPGQASWQVGADSFRMLPYIDGIVDALQAAYDERNNECIRERVRQGALAYDTATVHERYWRPALKAIEAIVDGVGGELKLVTF